MLRIIVLSILFWVYSTVVSLGGCHCYVNNQEFFYQVGQRFVGLCTSSAEEAILSGRLGTFQPNDAGSIEGYCELEPSGDRRDFSLKVGLGELSEPEKDVVQTDKSAQRRLAFVVGVDNYENVRKLDTPVADAAGYKEALETHGFEVTQLLNPTKWMFETTFAEFQKKIRPQDVTFFVFGGHGVDIGEGGGGRLLPADIPPIPFASADELQGLVKDWGIAIDSVIRSLKAAGSGTQILIIDACRDNPYVAAGDLSTRLASRTIVSKLGFSRPQQLPEGTFVGYSADKGQLALDSLVGTDNRHSLFGRVFIPMLKEGRLTLTSAFIETQRRVKLLARELEKHKQEPAYYNALGGQQICLSRRCEE